MTQFSSRGPDSRVAAGLREVMTQAGLPFAELLPDSALSAFRIDPKSGAFALQLNLRGAKTVSHDGVNITIQPRLTGVLSEGVVEELQGLSASKRAMLMNFTANITGLAVDGGIVTFSTDSLLKPAVAVPIETLRRALQSLRS